jgi:hypothetical protein
MAPSDKRSKGAKKAPSDKGATLDSGEFQSLERMRAEMNTADVCVPVRRHARGRFIRVHSRRFWRSAEDAFDGVIVRAEDLLEDLVERVRERTRPTAPAPDPDAQRPTLEEWAGWAKENLSPRDARGFSRPAEGDRVERV